MILLILCIILVSVILYKRYIPVAGVRHIQWTEWNGEGISVVDVREYNESDKKPIKGAINIPVGYFRRHLGDIPEKKLHLIVSNSLEKNVSIRFLRKKGFQIVGYTILNTRSCVENKHLRMDCTC